MKKLLKADFFRLFHDTAFKFSLIVALALPVLGNLLFLVFKLFLFGSSSESFAFPSGAFSYFIGFLPVVMGMLLPIIIGIFVCAQFSQGIIRSKIIAGHKRIEIYFGLYIVAMAFEFMILAIYLLLNLGMGSLCGLSFDFLFGDHVTWQYFLKVTAVGLLTYLALGTLSFFLSFSIQVLGGVIPLLAVPVDLLFSFGVLSTQFLSFGEDYYGVFRGFIWADPLCAISSSYMMYSTAISPTSSSFIDEMFLANGVMSIVYVLLFLGFGLLIFSKRDIK